MVGVGKKVLEVGCATGYMTKVLKEEYDCRVTCVEINSAAARKARKYCDEIIVGDIETVNLSGLLKVAEFDVIVMGDILEHLRDPLKILEELRPHLLDNGYLLASIPNVTYAGLVLDLMEGNFSYRPLGLLDETHLRFFTRRSIDELFARAGYAISTWDSTVIPPAKSEFKKNLSDYPLEVIGFLYENPDAETYQFVVKALKRNEKSIPACSVEAALASPKRERTNATMPQHAVQKLLEAKDRELQEALFQLDSIQSSRSFRLLTRCWRFRRRLLPDGTRRDRLYRLCIKTAAITMKEGPLNMVRKAWHHLKWSGLSNFSAEALNKRLYQAWMETNEPKAEELPWLQNEARSLAYKPLISIVMPVYNTDEMWLRAAIESVLEQLYPNWELCIADDGSTKPGVKRVLDEYLQRDKRVKVTYLPKKQGIICASNAAMSLATGEFVGLLGDDDELAPWALLEVVKLLSQNPSLDFIYSDEDKLEPDGRRSEPFFKPDFSPDLLMSMNYICHFSVFRRLLFDQVGGFRKGLDGSQDYDLILRVSEQTKNIAHIPKILYHWRKIPGSASIGADAKSYAYPAGLKALEETLGRRKQPGKVAMLVPGRYHVRYEIVDRPLVSIIIPTKDKARLLRHCFEAIEKKSTYRNYEIIIVDNGSTQPAAQRYLDYLRRQLNCKVISFNETFNYSRMNNLAAKHAHGDFLLFLNNDTEVITPDWLEEMIGHAQRAEVGAVGVKLLYRDHRIQHGGVVVGIGGLADHAFCGLPSSQPGYMGLAAVTRNCSAVTAACMMMRRTVFEEAGGFDEELVVAFNDVDLCLRLARKGYYIVYTPHVALFHYEGKTRGEYAPYQDICHFRKRWSSFRDGGDPFYNPNLAWSHGDFMINARLL
jgi:GT2 family glycosyltransferase/2-polyprenyl-3-methyl-5-hydroxy-6-metoxy-1,4-benzoquinol methylase